jgi:hypothetical protein
MQLQRTHIQASPISSLSNYVDAHVPYSNTRETRDTNEDRSRMVFMTRLTKEVL